MRYISIFALAIVLTTSALAQEITLPKADSFYKKNPVWIQMMEADNVNFFQVEKAFELFWENRAAPLEEHDVIGEAEALEKKEKNYIKRLFKRNTLTDKELAFAVKRYKQWHFLVFPYVQNDGTVLTRDEQLEIWRKEKMRPKL